MDLGRYDFHMQFHLSLSNHHCRHHHQHCRQYHHCRNQNLQKDLVGMHHLHHLFHRHHNQDSVHNLILHRHQGLHHYHHRYQQHLECCLRLNPLES